MNNLYFSDRSVTYAQFLEDVSRKVACLVEKRLDERLKERQQADLVTTEEAARILGITPDRLRHIKNRFPHVKGGEKQQGKLLFKRDALLASY
jgi:hypothetical protein